MNDFFSALASTTPASSVACGTPPAGVSAALVALAKNGLNSFLDKITQIGMKLVEFQKVFLEELGTSIWDTMCVP